MTRLLPASLGPTRRLARGRLATLGVMLAASGLAIASGADFTTASANPATTFASGTLSMLNSKAGAAIMTASGLFPGDSVSGSVDIKNTGSGSGTFTLSKSGLTNTPASPAFATKLTVVVTDCGTFSGSTPPDCTTGTTQLYSGAIGSMGTIALGSYAAGAQHRYKFAVTFPDGGTGGADNAYQGALTSVQYDWNAVS